MPDPPPPHWILVTVLPSAHPEPPGGTRLFLKGTAHSIQARGPIGHAFFVDPTTVPADSYVIQLLWPRNTYRYIEVIVGFDGKLIRDPLAAGTPLSPTTPAKTVQIVLNRPVDFQAQCFFLLESSTSSAQVGGGTLWLGDRAMTSATTQPSSPIARYYRAIVPLEEYPFGEYQLKLEHRRYVLPSETPLVLRSTLEVRRFAVTPVPGTISVLELRGTTYYVDRGHMVQFTTNVPPTSAATVQWRCSDPRVLTLVKPGIFRGGDPGAAEISVIYEELSASATVVVRAAPGDPVCTPPDAADIVHDAWTGSKVVRGILLCAFKAGVAENDVVALLTRFDLKRVGTTGATAIDLLRYDTNKWTLQALLKELDADPRIDFVTPDAVASWNSIAPHVPKEVPGASSWWHLFHTEAYAAFGLMKQDLRRKPEVVTFVEAGIAVSPTGVYLSDFGGRVRLDLSRVFYQHHYGPPLTPRALADDDARLHGNKVVSVAVAGWSDGRGVGIDPEAGIAILKCPETLGYFTASMLTSALTELAGRIAPGLRVVDITTTIECTGFFRSRHNKSIARAVRLIVQKGGLVVIAAGNQRGPIRDTAVCSVASALEKEYLPGAITVGGTELFRTGTGDVFEQRLGIQGTEGTNYDPPGTVPLIDLAAPGDGVRVSDATGVAVFEVGTSFSAPLVAGLAALLWSVLPQEPPGRIKQILIDTSDTIVPVSGSAATRPAKLWTNADKLIGIGRVNVWQALLLALNERERRANSGVRHVGLRAAARRHRLRLFLEYDALPEEQIEAVTMLAGTNSFEGTRVTAVNRKPQQYPKSLRAEEKQADGTWATIYRRKLVIDVNRIDRLAPRHVITCLSFLDGGVELKKVETPSLKPNLARLTVLNSGKAPDPRDPELLDPFSRNPLDHSLKPWMKLAAGDSYALTYEVLSGPPGLQVRFLDATQMPLPPGQVDEEGHPYVTVPFAGPPIAVHAEGVFPSDPEPANATVKIEVVSLNNDVVRSAQEVLLRPATPTDATILIRPPGWVFDLSSDNVWGASPAAPLSCQAEPGGWTCRIHKGFEETGGHWFDPITMKFKAPETAAPGSTGGCTFMLGQQALRWKARLALPDVEWICEQPTAAGVVAEGGAVRATFAIRLRNRSMFRVHVKGVEAIDALLPSHTPPGPHTKILFRRPGATLPSLAELVLPALFEVAGEVTVYYAPAVLQLPAGSVGTRRIRMFLWDPYRTAPDQLPGPRFVTQDLVVTVPLHR